MVQARIEPWGLWSMKYTRFKRLMIHAVSGSLLLPWTHFGSGRVFGQYRTVHRSKVRKAECTSIATIVV